MPARKDMPIPKQGDKNQWVRKYIPDDYLALLTWDQIAAVLDTFRSEYRSNRRFRKHCLHIDTDKLLTGNHHSTNTHKVNTKGDNE